ncbi:DMT family transporter [Oerskovia flava]|uniref:DMT family transporter n=1 Tax=Oerskovia flava TaxID=2986422 RepID=UPI0022404977|nr:multidrug efflux SMR transporter [Oerskovia sp. JB1-3-2]
MAWVILVLSGMLEAGWALSLKASDGFTKLWPSVSFVVLLVLSMVGLSYALRTLPVGIAYGVWVGIGASLTAVVAVVLFDETVTVLKIVSLVLIIAGVVGLNLSGGGHA